MGRIDACDDIAFISDLDKAGRQQSFNDEVDAEKDLRGINVINIFIGPQNASRNDFFVISAHSGFNHTVTIRIPD